VSNGRLIANDELKKIWKGAFMTYVLKELRIKQNETKKKLLLEYAVFRPRIEWIPSNTKQEWR
jgi:hypothetical protein